MQRTDVMARPLRILIVRRDNIGDLVCTTPLIAGLRSAYKNAWIGVLANSYNAPVLENNPDIDRVYAYRKTKHGGMNWFRTASERLRLIAGLRRQALDYAIVATPAHRDRGLRMARLAGAKHVIAFVRPGASTRGIDSPVLLQNTGDAHEVELVWGLAQALGIEGVPPPCKVVVSPEILSSVQAAVAQHLRNAAGPLVGIHLSARLPSQRWPAARFSAVMKELHRKEDACFMLFWAPGDESNPQHPGDDAKAQEVIQATRHLPVLAWPTHDLRELIGGIAACERLLLADGGAMHIAAALAKPIVTLFGDSDAKRWRPWGTECEILQAKTRHVTAISVQAVLEAFDRLGSRLAPDHRALPSP